MSECCDNIIDPMENQTGLTMNPTSGPLSWPYAACTGSVNKNGIFTALTPEKGLQKCLEFCNKRKNLTGKDNPSTDFTKLTGIGNASSGIQQCHMIYKQLKQENYMENPPQSNDSNCYWVIPLVLVSFLLIGLIMLQK